MASQNDDIPGVPEIRKQLERMLKDRALRSSPSQAKLLDFVVKSALEDKEIREADITDVLFPLGHHDPEPSNARATATNLRKTLAKYYNETGGDDPVIIELPPGKSYKPLFGYNPRSAVDGLYRRGLAHTRSFLSSEDLRSARECFSEAIRLEPTFAVAYSMKADVEFREAIYRSDEPPGKWVAMAQASAVEALFWSPQCWRAHVVMGAVHCSRFQWDDATQAFDEALRVAPLETGEHLYYAAFLAAMGRMEEASRITRSCMKRHPDDPFAKLVRAAICYVTRESEFMLAEECVFAAIRDNENLWVSYVLLACVRYSVGRLRGMLSSLAERYIKQAHDLFRMEVVPGAAILCFCLVLDETSDFHEKHARKAQMHQRISDLEIRSRESYVAPFQLALAHLGAHEMDEAVDDLRRACEEGDPKMVWLHLWPMFDPLQGHEPFRALVNRMKLP